MTKKTFTFTTPDNKKIFVYEWLPDGKPKACIQISHGMAEHAKRYNEFALELNKAGFAVYANDHRGHGRTAEKLENLGFFAEKDGWFKVVQDMKQLTDIINKENPTIPIFLFGHSMGSLLIRTYVMKNNSENIAGIILSGTSGEAGFIVNAGKFLAKTIGTFKGKTAPSKLLDNMSFGKFNKPFKPNRTKFDWLSRDNENVDKYVNDPFCGTVFTNRFFYDMLTGVSFINKSENINKINSSLPIYLLSGTKDPVGDFGKGVEKVFNIYKNIGIENIKMKLYQNGRHENINETNRKEIYKDVIEWINNCLTLLAKN